MRRRRRSGWLILLVVLAVFSAAGSVQAQSVPGNAGNLDDGGPVDPADVLALRGADASWIPTAGEMLQADCEASVDPPEFVEEDGVVRVRGWGHWSCNRALPGSYLEVCLDAVVPSVACNEKFVPPPRTAFSVKVDFPCVPGVYVTMATGSNPFDTNRSNDTAHAPLALIVLPADCKYVQAGP